MSIIDKIKKNDQDRISEPGTREIIDQALAMTKNKKLRSHIVGLEMIIREKIKQLDDRKVSMENLIMERIEIKRDRDISIKHRERYERHYARHCFDIIESLLENNLPRAREHLSLATQKQIMMLADIERRLYDLRTSSTAEVVQKHIDENQTNDFTMDMRMETIKGG